MSFVNPIFLFGLFFAAIPVLIHLFNLRRFKKIYFSNVSMLKELKQETQKKSRLKHLLVLFSRILAIASLVFAFAQPYIPISDAKVNFSGSNVSVYIDNTFSMESVSKKGNLFNEACVKAKEIADAYGSTDLFQLLSADFEGIHQSFYSKEDFIRMLQDLSISSSTRMLSDVVSRQYDILGSARKSKVVYILSDFQKSVTDIKAIKLDSSVKVFLVPLSASKSQNIYIDSCWFDKPVMHVNYSNILNVRVKNNSSEDVEKIPVKLSVNGVQKALASIDIPAGSQDVAELKFSVSEQGIMHAKVEIVDFPVTFDDSYFFSFIATSKIPVLSINGTSESTYIKALFDNDSAISYTSQNEKNIDFSLLKANACVILNDIKSISSGMLLEVQNFVKNGGTLVIFPSSEMDKTSYSNLASSLKIPYYSEIDTSDTKVDKINSDHNIYHGVFDKIVDNIDLPKVFSHYKILGNQNVLYEVLLRMQNGNSFFISSPSGKGKVFLSSVPLLTDWSNFPKNAIFVPTLFNIALYSKQNTNLSYTVGNDEPVELAFIELDNDATFSIKGYKKAFEIIPEHKNSGSEYLIFPHEQITESGNYILNSGNKEQLGLAYNYNRLESDLKCYTTDELEQLIKENNLKNFSILDTRDKSISTVLDELNQGIRLWKWFVILALIFLLTEILLLRFK